MDLLLALPSTKGQGTRDAAIVVFDQREGRLLD
jgi:hypothetical protein